MMDELLKDFIAEAREGIEALDTKIVAFEQNPDDPELLVEIFRLVHNIKGTSGFIGLTRLQSLAHAAENVLDGFREGRLVVEGASVSAVLETLDVLRSVLNALAVDGVEPVGDDRALIARLDAIDAGGSVGGSTSAGRPWLDCLGGEATLDAACEAALMTLAADPALAAGFADCDLVRVQAKLRAAMAETARAGAGPLPLSDLLRDLLPALPTDAAGAVEAALRQALADLEVETDPVDRLFTAPLPVPANAPTARPAAEPEPPGQTIRVNVDMLEDLMTKVSELVLIRNQLIQTLRAQQDTPFADPLHRLNTVTSELQEAVMTTRMQPISGAWAKLPRLVRDLAADLGKKIVLTTSGQDTELDRQVLELIKDPLTHMIRNAADHGLETPAERLAAGKSETGRIRLQARHEGGEIIVELSDDGRGLSAERVRAKALSLGLITPAQAAAMGDAEARQLIFMPGFSTADQVTSVSGRGVGMDVVRSNIEKIGGAVDLTSTEGQGTRFIIRIPLTLSIVSVLIVDCCGTRFAMPQAGVVELVNAQGGDGQRIEHIGGSMVLRLRDRLLPLVSLQQLLGLPAPAEPSPDACIVVARVGAFSFGVVVDRVFDIEEIVVKPVASMLRHLKVYSGATILGDGSVIMILDFVGISVQIGAGHLMSGADDAVLEAAPRPRTETLLVFQADGARKAALLSQVARIEEVAAATLESSGGRSLLQYGGRLMPVVGVDGHPAPARPGRMNPLLVFTEGDNSLALQVDEIIDIVEAPFDTLLPSGGPGAAGNLIVAGHATELIDIGHYWRCAGFAREPVQQPGFGQGLDAEGLLTALGDVFNEEAA